MAKHHKPTTGGADRKSHAPDRSTGRAATVPAPAGRAKLAAPHVPGPSPDAVALFQEGMEALQQHRYNPAAERFRMLVEKHPTERALLDRARVYLELCARELSRRPAEPRTIEERLTAATAALNNGALDRAENLARGVLAEHPRQDLALYLLAVIEVRRGNFEKALSYLGQAIAISPEAKAQARHEADFEPLRDLDAFHELTELPPPAAPGGPRRPRRSTR